MGGNLGINPSFKEFSSFKELEISNIQAEGILIMSKQGMDGDSDVAANSRPASVLLRGNHLVPPDSPRASAWAGQHAAPHLLQHKSPLNIFYHCTSQAPNDTLRNNLSTWYVFSIASVFCNFVKLEMSLRGAGEK